MSDIVTRKDEHLDIVLSGQAGGTPGATSLDQVLFEHVALPELAFDDIELGAEFLGYRLRAPLLISSMTGGPERAAQINANLAQAAQALGIALGIGSQRVALETGKQAGLNANLRAMAPSVPLLANFGAAQLRTWDGHAMARRAVEMIGADALIIHLNPLQEALQPGGDRDWRGLLVRIEALAAVAGVPIIAKEVGAGISGRVARKLVDAGVSVIDVAGAGGTSWAAVEGERAGDPGTRALASLFRDWGIPTAHAIADVRAACPDTPLIASGGIRHGLDVARAIRLGADLAGQAAGVLPAALTSADAVIEHFSGVIAALRIACFCTGSTDLAQLRRAALIGAPVISNPLARNRAPAICGGDQIP
jgi:isopentenyl-diphosphate delta-isomerase